ncbi:MULTISPECIES: hypothetical protein [unclassified Moraxella]|uniref:hypothetical protein n=1 Tax=unclassified Moraxella TaxID=2685852 RepID=UPI003AF5A374
MSNLINHLSSTQSSQPCDLLTCIGTTLPTWQVHRCQLTTSIIDQHAPIKFLYHYETLTDTLKLAHPLQGALLQHFDRLLTRQQFAELLGLDMTQVAMPWQLKFSGKLVVFCHQPEIALRLHWTNTAKAFELGYQSDLETAVTQAFRHWQWVDGVEVVNKNPNVSLFASLVELVEANTASDLTLDNPHPLVNVWQQSTHQGFEALPTAIAVRIQRYLRDQDDLIKPWLEQMQDMAMDEARQYLAEL